MILFMYFATISIRLTIGSKNWKVFPVETIQYLPQALRDDSVELSGKLFYNACREFDM